MIIDGPDERLMTEKDLESYDTVYIIWNPRFDNSKILGFNVNFEIFQFMTSTLIMTAEYLIIRVKTLVFNG